MALRPLDLIRLLAFTLVLFSSGLITGWWLHLRWPLPGITHTNHGSTSIFTLESPFTPGKTSGTYPSDTSSDQLEFHQALEDNRYDDALTIYQRHESNDSALSSRLRNTLLEKTEEWVRQKKHTVATETLERFTNYYYQDIELLKKLALAYEADQQLDKTIETYINARTYAYQKDQLAFINTRIHNLAPKLYGQQKKHLSQEGLIPLLQKLAYLEPDYAFYRFALAESYAATSDIDSAIRELEMLQLDPDFGNRASRLLAELLPPPPPPEDTDEPVYSIPLAGSGGHYVVNAIAGDKYNIRLLIDTGSSLTTLPSHLLQELRRREIATRIAHIEMKTANGARMAPVYRLKEFQIGQYSLFNIEVAELELGDYSKDGLLGMNVLSKFHFFIDQNRQTLSLTPR